MLLGEKVYTTVPKLDSFYIKATPAVPLLVIHSKDSQPQELALAYGSRARTHIIKLDGGRSNSAQVEKTIQDVDVDSPWLLLSGIEDSDPSVFECIVTKLEELETKGNGSFRLWLFVLDDKAVSLPGALIKRCIRFMHTRTCNFVQDLVEITTLVSR